MTGHSHLVPETSRPNVGVDLCRSYRENTTVSRVFTVVLELDNASASRSWDTGADPSESNPAVLYFSEKSRRSILMIDMCTPTGISDVVGSLRRLVKQGTLSTKASQIGACEYQATQLMGGTGR